VKRLAVVMVNGNAGIQSPPARLSISPPAAHSRAPQPPLRPLFPLHARTVNTNGSIAEDEEMGEVIQLQGDQRANVKEWLMAQEIVGPGEVDRIVIHGF
jgi:hypothetical protein